LAPGVTGPATGTGLAVTLAEPVPLSKVVIMAVSALSGVVVAAEEAETELEDELGLLVVVFAFAVVFAGVLAVLTVDDGVLAGVDVLVAVVVLAGTAAVEAPDFDLALELKLL
jgi:hypothetical protein